MRVTTSPPELLLLCPGSGYIVQQDVEGLYKKTGKIGPRSTRNMGERSMAK
jgi:hypothetical protein